MNTKHTPGPWTSENRSFQHDTFDGIPIIEAGTGYGIASAWQVDNIKASDTQRANAHLIAAAPDLLAALKVMLANEIALAESGDAGFWDPETTDHVKQARAAIAKAEGKQ